MVLLSVCDVVSLPASIIVPLLVSLWAKEGVRSIDGLNFIDSMFSIVRLYKSFTPGMRCCSFLNFLSHPIPEKFKTSKILSVNLIANLLPIGNQVVKRNVLHFREDINQVGPGSTEGCETC